MADAKDSLSERFWQKVARSGPEECWPFVGCISTKTGYGRIAAGQVLGGPEVWGAHRVAYVLANGYIEPTAEVDHVCHTRDLQCLQGAQCPHRRCVNPAHLEAVTHRENALRREARVPSFRNCDHPLVPENIGKNLDSRRCKVCHREKERLRRAAMKAAAVIGTKAGEVI